MVNIERSEMVRSFFKLLRGDLTFSIFTLLFIVLFFWSLYDPSVRLSSGFTLFWGAISMNSPSIVVIFYAVFCVGSGRLKLNLRKERTELIVSILGKADQRDLASLGSRNGQHRPFDDAEITEIE